MIDVFWRLLGQRGRPKFPGQAVPVVDYLTSRTPGIGWRQPAGTLAAYRARNVYDLQPGVGGFGVNTQLAVIPDPALYAAVTVDGGQVMPATRFFLPGLYRVRMEWVFIATAVVGEVYAVTAFRAATTDTLALGDVPRPGQGNAQFPFVRPLSGTSTCEHVFLAEDPFKLAILCFTAITDPTHATVSVDVQCITPLDQPEGT